jgi:hypothetical protein
MSISNTQTGYIYTNYWDFVYIEEDEFTVNRKYGQFRGKGPKDYITKRVLSYNRTAIVSNRPIYNFILKDIQRQPFVFIEPI